MTSTPSRRRASRLSRHRSASTNVTYEVCRRHARTDPCIQRPPSRPSNRVGRLVVLIVASIAATQFVALAVLGSGFPYTPSPFRAVLEATLIPLLPLARKDGRFTLEVFRRKWLYWPLTRARRLVLMTNRKMASLFGLRTEIAGPIIAYVDTDAGSSVLVPMDQLPPKSKDRVRYVAISDTHLLHGDVILPASGDVLIHCGDILVEDRGERNDTNDRWKRLLKNFDTWLREHATMFEYILVTGGNHDKVLEDLGAHSVQAFLRHGIYINGGEVTIDISGVQTHRVYISAASRGYEGGGSNDAFQHSTDEAAESVWAEVPSGGKVDVLVTHGPPQGIHDGPGKNSGCPVLLKNVKERIEPRVHVFGHWHASPGAEKVGGTVFVNAATVDFDYAVTNPPVVFDL